MKKNLLLLLLGTLTLTGCATSFDYTPTHGGKYVPYDGDVEDDDDDEEEELTCIYNFYFSYSHTTIYDEVLEKDVACPIYTLRDVAMLKPLGEMPEAINSEAKVKALGEAKGFHIDSTFPKFLGFSFNSVCLDEEGIWDFTVNYKQLAVVNLYGVWVSE